MNGLGIFIELSYFQGKMIMFSFHTSVSDHVISIHYTLDASFSCWGLVSIKVKSYSLLVSHWLCVTSASWQAVTCRVTENNVWWPILIVFTLIQKSVPDAILSIYICIYQMTLSAEAYTFEITWSYLSTIVPSLNIYIRLVGITLNSPSGWSFCCFYLNCELLW